MADVSVTPLLQELGGRGAGLGSSPLSLLARTTAPQLGSDQRPSLVVGWRPAREGWAEERPVLADLTPTQAGTGPGPWRRSRERLLQSLSCGYR